MLILKSVAGEMHGKHSDGILAPLEQTIAHSGALIRYAPRNENFALVSRIQPEARSQNDAKPRADHSGFWLLNSGFHISLLFSGISRGKAPCLVSMSLA